jgi:hypothetical protein
MAVALPGAGVLKCSKDTEASGNSNTCFNCSPEDLGVNEKWKSYISGVKHTNASQTRFRIATSEPDSYFVFLLARLSNNATNVVLEFKIFANHSPVEKVRD